MDIEKFIVDRPYLYHLTCKENAKNIVRTRTLHSANRLIEMSGDPLLKSISRERRPDHQEVKVAGRSLYLRDQRPISVKNLAKCLTNGWEIGDFINHLNDRVFMWPTLNRLWAHFNRYQPEEPVIFRFSTKELLGANPHVKFCRLNSGATRSNSHHDGAPPDRGPDTFVVAGKFDRPVREVAEVTFEKECQIVDPFELGESPEGPYKRVKPVK